MESVNLPANTKEVVIPPKLVAPAVFGVVFLISIDFYAGLTYTKNSKLIFGVLGFLVVFGLSHFIKKFKFGIAHSFYVYAYHWITSFILIFVVPTLSFYLYMWILMMYLAEFFFQKKGTILSSLGLLATMILGSLYQNNGINKAKAIEMASIFFIIVCINQIMIKITFGNRKERSEALDKILHAEYEHDRLIALINSMSDGVIATDDKGIILNYNAAALDIIDTNATLTGKPLSDFLKLTDSKDNPVDILELAKSTSYIQRRSDLKIDIDEQDSVTLDINISRIEKSSILDRQEGFTFLFRDITLQKSLDDQKDMFIHEVSHELRTPITIAEGEISMAILLAEKSDPTMSEIIDTVKRGHEQVVFLGDLVNDLTALSRATRDTKNMKTEEFAVADVLNELNKDYVSQAEKKGLYLKVEIAPSIPNIVSSRLYFKEVLQNFVTNAIKYTNEGGITVKGQSIDKDHIMISVTDTGIGIAKSEVAKVFDKFWRSEDPLTRSTNGTGLGLYVTQQLAKNIGAEIKVQSKLKVGTTFSLIVSINGIEKPISKSPVRNFFGL